MRVTKKNQQQNGHREIVDAVKALCSEKDIEPEVLFSAIEEAMKAAYKKNVSRDEDAPSNLSVTMDRNTGDVHVFARKTITDDVEDPANQITLEEALKIRRDYRMGDIAEIDVTPNGFLRTAAQTAKQVIIQGIREAERGMIFDTFSSKEHEILSGSVLRADPTSGDLIIRLTGGSDKTSALLSRSEQVPTEHYTEGDMIRVYVVEVRRSNRGPQVIVSRTHPGLVKRLFELEVPEIASGAVEVKSIAREAGSRTKIAVHAAEANVDPVGACVGPRGGRVGAVVDELHGEKMDIVVWSEDPCQFVASALSPATVLSVSLLPGAGKACRVVVPDDQLSLAIGKEGQNARLAARLTGYKIDIRPASQADADEPEAPAELPAEPEEA